MSFERSMSYSATQNIITITTTAAATGENDPQPPPPPKRRLSHYESQKRRDWGTFCRFLRNHIPAIPLASCSSNHAVEFLMFLDQFGKTKVHINGCILFGQAEPMRNCPCPLRQAWGSLDALIGRMRAAYEENGGLKELNPFAGAAVKAYLRGVKETQSIARGVSFKKKKKNKNHLKSAPSTSSTNY